ncbi:MAG: ABC transporter permease [Anaerolineae bacterium]
MWIFIARRLVQTIPVLFGISVLTFILIYYLPADPARMYAGPSATVETVDRIRHELGLDLPLWQQYLRYIERLLQGDLGFSYRKQIAVTELILSRVPYTLALTGGGILVELVIGLSVGIVSALGRGRWPDRAGMLLALLGVSAPPFWLGLLFLYWFGFLLPIFPLGGTGTLTHLVLPALKTHGWTRRGGLVCPHDALSEHTDALESITPARRGPKD